VTHEFFTGASGVITQENSLNFRTCLNFGTNYYRTFDGLQFSFGGRCTYTMAMSEHWNVQMQVINCNLFDTCRKVCYIFLDILSDHLSGLFC